MEGRKNDQGKLRWSLVPLDAMREVVRVLMGGADQYAPDNWVEVENARERYYNAGVRHVTTWYEGDSIDAQWGLHHLAHGICCFLFLLALSLRGKIDRTCSIPDELDELDIDEPIPYVISKETHGNASGAV